MRLNLHPDSARVIPKWLEIMINEFVEEFRKEYSVGHNDVYRYFFSDKLERIQQLFADHNIKVEIYSIEDLPSRGIIIPDDDPTVVLYKLKHSSTTDDS